MRRRLNFGTRYEVDGFLKQHGIPLHYSEQDLESDIENAQQFSEKWLLCLKNCSENASSSSLLDRFSSALVRVEQNPGPLSASAGNDLDPGENCAGPNQGQVILFNLEPGKP